MYTTLCDGFDPTTHRRRDPPMPLGDTVDYFSVSAATPPGAIHPSGTSLRIKLDNPRPDSPFRSSQLVNGHVHIQSLQSFQIPNLSLRVYFESRTLYWRMELKGAANEFEQTLATIVSPSAQNYHRVMRHEVHRGVVPPSNVPLPWNTPVEVQANQELVLTFSFIIPRKMRITEYKDNPHTPRDLCPVERCHLLRFATQGSEVYNPDTLLRQATDDQVVTRIAFPFVPSLEDVSPLRDDVFFGQDLRKDASGSNRLTEEEVESGKNAVVERVKARGGKWEVYVKGFPAGKSKMWSELYTPSGAIVSTDPATLPIIVFLKHTGTQSGLRTLFRAVKPKPVHLHRAMVTLLRSTSTRVGKEIKPHVKNTLVRQQEPFFDGQSSTSPELPISYEDTDPVEVDLTFDLQSDMPSGNYASSPVKLYTPSFRTLNFQHETKSRGLWGKFPVQFVPAAGADGDQLPTFDEAVGRGAIPPTFDESVGTY